MAVEKEAQKNAQQCFTLARTVPSSESYIYWMNMGRLWSALAQNADQGTSGSTLFHDAAQMWVALASELGERVNGSRPQYAASARSPAAN